MVPRLLDLGAQWIAMPLDTKSPLRLAANAARLRRLIGLAGISLVHARSRAPAWSALWAARRTGTPFVATWHGAYSAGSAPKRFYNSVMLRGDAVIANSRWTAEHIGATYRVEPKRLVVIPRGVDLDLFNPARVALERAASLRKAWGAAAGDLVVMLPGRMTRWKGQLVLIDAVTRLARAGKAIGLRTVLAGDPQGRSEYVAEVENAIRGSGLADAAAIAGHVEDMPAAYLAADIVVSASTEPEAFGRVAAEAGAMGRPVIATDHGGARETVLPGRSGFLVPPGDAGALAAAVEKLLVMDPQRRAAMGAEGRAHIAREFALAAMTDATLALYRDVLDAHRAAA